ncbi:MAG: Cytochrome c oxidase polypeptide, partial [Labilithrix sp.]|nr:Cytochrome c oxidase polypeptide [Labilithrix sp.]
MSTETTAGHHPHKDDGAVHAHISSTPFYVAVFMALIALTVLTVGQSYVDLGRLNLIVVILIATTKASLVVSFFMHLRYDNKFNALIFVSCIFFIGVFFAYTMNDTGRRGELDGDQNVRVLPKTGED